MYNLRMTDTFPLVSEWLKPATLKAAVFESNSLEVFYWPFNTGGLSKTTDKLWVKQWVKTDDIATESEACVRAERLDQELQLTFSDKLYDIVTCHPPCTPHFCNFLFKTGLKPATNVLPAPEAIHYQYGIDNIPCYDLEFAFKVNADFSNVVEGLHMVIDKIYDDAGKGKYPFNLPAEFRICKASQAFLSPGYDTDPNALYCFLEVLSIKGTGGYDAFSAELGDAWMKRFGGRPHWAKMWEHVPDVHARLRAQPGNVERFAKFENVRKKYDPKEIFFGNASLRAVIRGEKLPAGFNGKAVAGF
ncbi:D-arabinono-1,4-lactone oxidase-domain-containing protein, partial [Jimgerdemannia flammicorona]